MDGLSDAFGNDPGGGYIPLIRFTPSYWKVQKLAYEAGGTLIAFYRRKIKAAQEKLASGEEPSDFVTCYLKEIENIDKVDSKIKEDWTIQVGVIAMKQQSRGG